MGWKRSKPPSPAETAAVVEGRYWKPGRRLTAAEERAAERSSAEYQARIWELRAKCPESNHDRCRSH